MTITGAGWYHEGAQLRYYDGEQWTGHYTPPLTDTERMARLDTAVAEQIRGRFDVRVESRTPFQAVLVYGKNMSGGAHVVYALLSIFTCGLFLIPWIIQSNSSGERRVVLSVDPFGKI